MLLAAALLLGACCAVVGAGTGLAVEIRVNLIVPTTTALTAGSSSAVEGETVTFRANVSPIPGTNGTVMFIVNGTEPAAAAAVDSSGEAVFRTALLAAGDHVIKAQYNGDGGGNPSTSNELKLTVRAGSSPPIIVSGPSAGVATGMAGQPVLFTVSATGTPLILYTWDFGDAVIVTTNSTNVLHTFSAPVTYTITVTVSDGTNQTAIGSMSFPVAATAALPRDPWMVVSASVGLNFKTPGKDKVSVVGILELPAGFDPAGKAVSVDVGGATQTFMLDGKGMAKTGKDSFRLVRKLQHKQFRGGASKVQFKLNGALAAALADDGLTNETIPKPGKSASVQILFGVDNQFYTGTATILWTATAGKSGKGRWRTAVR